MNILGIIVGFIILGYAIKGLKNGLILTVCSFTIIFIAIAVTQIITPQVTSLLYGNELFVNAIRRDVDQVIFSKGTNEENGGSDVSLQDENGQDSNEPSEDKIRIEKLNMPVLMKEQLLENYNREMYNSLGAASIEDYVSRYIAYSLINCGAYIVVFVIVMALLKVTARLLNIVAKLPVIHTLNKFGGFAIGLAEGVIVTWVLFIFFVVAANTEVGMLVYEDIESSIWLSYLYDNNLIMNALSSVMKGIC